MGSPQQQLGADSYKSMLSGKRGESGEEVWAGDLAEADTGWAQVQHWAVTWVFQMASRESSAVAEETRPKPLHSAKKDVVSKCQVNQRRVPRG